MLIISVPEGIMFAREFLALVLLSILKQRDFHVYLMEIFQQEI